MSQRVAVAISLCLAPFVALCLGSFAQASEGSSAPVQRAESLPAPPAEASATNTLSLAQLEQMALSFNPSLARAAAIVRAQSGKAYQAGLLPNPSVGYEGQQLGSGGQAEQQGVLFSQEIIRGGKLRLDRGAAQRDISIAQQEFAAQGLRVLTDVRIAYYQVLLAQRQIDLMANLLRISQEGEQVVDSLFREKEVGEADVVQAELEVENAKILVENAHNRHDAAWRSLAAVVGNPGLSPHALAGDALAPPLDLKYDDVLARIRGMSPELSAAAIEVERARVVFERARAEPISNVTVQGLVNVIDNGISGKPDGGLAVTMPVPIFNRNQGSIMRAQQEIIAARNALAQVELSLQNRLAPTFEQYRNARNQVVRYREKILPTAQRSLDLTRNMYKAGELNYVGFLTAQRTFAYTHLNYLDALQALRISETEIEGLLLRGSLDFRSPTSAIPELYERFRSAPIGGVELFR